MNEFEILKQELRELQDWKKSMESSNSIPLNVDQAFRDRFGNTDLNAIGILSVPNGGTGAATLTGSLVGNGVGAITTITPLSGTKVYYVADSSGGAVNRKLTFSDGILTSQT